MVVDVDYVVGEVLGGWVGEEWDGFCYIYWLVVLVYGVYVLVGFVDGEWNGGGYLCFDEVWCYCVYGDVFVCVFFGIGVDYVDYCGFGGVVVGLF